MSYFSVPGLIADADISANQFESVKMGTATDMKISKFAANTDSFLGVLQNKPSADGEPAEVAYIGVCKARLGGTVTRGDQIEPAADGEMVSATEITDGGAATVHVVGVALQSGVDQDVVLVLLNGNQGNHS